MSEFDFGSLLDNKELDNNISTEITYIYFIKAERLGYIKIGISVNPIKRLQQLQASLLDNIELLTYTFGDRETEKYLHKRFSKFNYKNEWFLPEKEILSLITKIKKCNIAIDKIKDNIKELIYNTQPDTTK